MGRVWEGPQYPESGVLGGRGVRESVLDCPAVCPAGTFGTGSGPLVLVGAAGASRTRLQELRGGSCWPSFPGGVHSHPRAGRGEPLGPHHFGFVHSELVGERDYGVSRSAGHCPQCPDGLQEVPLLPARHGQLCVAPGPF